MDTDILRYVFRIWLCEIGLSALNYFVFMRRVYEPRWGELRAHQIGMTIRIMYIFGFAYALDHDVGLGARLHHYPHELSGGELDFRTGVQILTLLRAHAEGEPSSSSRTTGKSRGSRIAWLS